MATQPRQASKTKPITTNPLFPAVVALWFGAAFGLSSLAVRPSLLEEFVIKSRIDMVLPAAAPPLGITARILVALALAAFGALLGAFIARRIARPKTESRERNRDLRAAADEPRLRARDSHPDAPARRPISAHEELGGDAAALPPGLNGNKRRALALSDEPDPFIPHEAAPLPGGLPVILDLAGAELDQEDFAAPAVDLNAFESVEDEDEEEVPALHTPAAPNPLNWGQARPVLPLVAEAAGDETAHGEARQVFQSSGEVPAQPDDVMAGRQVFGQAPIEPQDPATRQIFGANSGDDPMPTDVLRDSGYQASVFDTPPALPLFAERQVNSPEPAIVSTTHDISALGMTDLAVRLQESMKRRRALRVAANAASHEPEVTVTTPAVPLDFGPQSEQPPAFAVNPFASPDASRGMPLALRPISFDDLSDEDDTLPSHIPPRSIVPVPAATPRAADPQTTNPFSANETVAAADETEADPGYASLLDLGQARSPFIRIEEPEAEASAIEPVVIFPGQAPRVALASQPLTPSPQVAPVVSPNQANTGPFRRFDAPGSAGQGQPVSATGSSPSIDRDEAERALRLALSSLQRISGAA